MSAYAKVSNITHNTPERDKKCLQKQITLINNTETAQLSFQTILWKCYMCNIFGSNTFGAKCSCPGKLKEGIPFQWIMRQHYCNIRILSLFPCALNHGILLAGVLKAGRWPGDWPAVGAWHSSLNIPLQEVKQWVPPGVGEVVVGGTFQSLSRK